MSSTNTAQVLSSVIAWRHLSAWDGFSTNNFSLKRMFPTFSTILQNSVVGKKNPTEADRYLEIDRSSVCSEKNARAVNTFLLLYEVQYTLLYFLLVLRETGAKSNLRR